jgi:hypothetical protein
MCTKLLGSDKKIVIGIIPPGAGKTWVIANLAMFTLKQRGQSHRQHLRAFLGAAAGAHHQPLHQGQARLIFS